MKKIECETEVSIFLEKMRRAIAKSSMKGIVSFECSEEEFTVVFERMGRSRIFFHLERSETGFKADFKKEDIALSHAFFKKEVERDLTKIMLKFGASVD